MSIIISVQNSHFHVSPSINIPKPEPNFSETQHNNYTCKKKNCVLNSTY